MSSSILMRSGSEDVKLTNPLMKGASDGTRLDIVVPSLSVRASLETRELEFQVSENVEPKLVSNASMLVTVRISSVAAMVTESVYPVIEAVMVTLPDSLGLSTPLLDTVESEPLTV